MKNFFLTSLLSLISLSSFSTTYYVSNSGSNSNDGLTSPTAFLTLQHASDIVTAGDSVVVLAGTYTGFYQTTSGTSSQRIIFAAQEGAVITQPNATTDDGINLEGASYITIEGFKVFGMPRTGIRTVTNDHVIIRNNVCDSCEVWGILTGFSDYILIENNTCTRAVEQHGIYFGNSADYPVIRSNLCWGNNDCGIHMNGDASLGGDGIISYGLVENNICYDNGVGGGSAINCDGVQHTIIQNNLLYNNHASGISLFRIDGGGGSNYNVVVNNTILQPSDGRWALNISDGSTNNIAFNNILYSTHVFRGSISIDAASMTGFKSNFNIQTDRMSTDGGNTVITLALWQQNTQLDSNSFIALPAQLFVNAVDDYHLSFTSPAIDQGTESYFSIAAPANDLDGAPRPFINGFDIGCYEAFPSGIQETFNQQTSDEIAAGDEVLLFDLSGRLAFDGQKPELETAIKKIGCGLYCYVAYSSQTKIIKRGKIFVAQ
ncbi:MAG TPA: right-handed parallel beta-helix repeat-containing protein [Chitinophagales bacterium]|nr:right-handed parallel beta-helix repeat-containing protein [Chitinophagales bacterium]